MTEIREMGHLCPTDNKGYIVNEADLGKINTKFMKAIQSIQEHCLSALPEEIHSIYIRGSIPKGLGIEGVSDLDAIIITFSNPEGLDLGWVEMAERSFNQSFPFLSGVELAFYPLNEMNVSGRFSMIPFMIKTHSVCVYGEDLRNSLPDYKADTSLANEHLIHLKSLMDQAEHDLAGNDDTEDIKDCCAWIMKIMVRAGLALVIVQEKSYTRDLSPAYKLFSKHYPVKEKEMRTALGYAVNPSSDPAELLRFLNGFGHWLLEEAEHWLEIHNPARELNLILEAEK